VVDLTGMLEVHNLIARATDLRGSFLDGPFEAWVAPAARRLSTTMTCPSPALP
jgi:hypothetical protein